MRFPLWFPQYRADHPNARYSQQTFSYPGKRERREIFVLTATAGTRETPGYALDGLTSA